ncbi:hypothetical protein ABB37_01271 [Leptomonas pyrrhocoris]|uniref:Uncharacterized protein n=1 Tax=Leptomonas pyrrhocoris TaxID=157538 RepID=A0A0M9G8Q0_LEPPY|nr:hypothetical protein ABB37_01271 [Leptomonas pyrrhocoris]KPA84789.1 hypothetical protein ABB37_01271 [Leptomonas pyrrhocoris]|eukprot:XP_015663228.1 hypothetical protein ABB37_01271 [Leptomonas pyrrhocoris]
MDSQGVRLRLHFVDSSDDDASHEAQMQFGSPHDDDNGSVDNPPHFPGGSGSNNISINNHITISSFVGGPGNASGNAHQPYGGASSSDARERRGGDNGGGSWLANAFYKAANSTATLFLGKNEESHAPYARSREPTTSSSTQPRLGGPPHSADLDRESDSNGGWEFGSSRHRSNTNDSSESPSPPNMEGSMAEEGDEYDQVSLDLRDTVLLFLQTGSDVFMNIILATLKASNEPVDGETFEIASGNPTLLKVFLDSGRVNVEDPRVQSVVQSKLNELLAGDPYRGDVIPGELLDYVRCLCNVKTSRITFLQMILFRYSGFDYIELLIDYPYLLNDVKRPRLCMRIFFSTLQYISICISWFGVVVALMYAAMTLWTVVYWFQHPENRNNGYWTIIAYVGGYVLSLVVTMRSEEGKISRYDNQLWRYPNNNLRIIPIFPLYEVMLSYISLRYEISADAKRFYIIRYDLRNGILIQQICNGYFYATPQLILQTFLFTEKEHEVNYLNAVVYWLLLGACCAFMLMSVFAYYRIGVFSHSCNSQGFAILSTQGNNADYNRSAKALSRRKKPSEVATRTLLFFTFYFLIAEWVTLLIFLLNLTGCHGGAVVFLAIWVVVIGCSIVFEVLSQVYLPISRSVAAVAIPAVIMKIAYFIYMRYETSNMGCIIFAYGYTGWMLPSLVCFGIVCMSLLACVAMFLYELILGTRITQSAVDQYLFA